MDDRDSQEMPGAIVEEYLRRERGTRTLLDELAALALEGRDERLRERIRAFADSDREVFFAVALALTGSKQFFGDVEAQLGVERADRLRALPETYPALADSFGLVRMEVSSDRHNPVTGLDVTTSYHDEEEVPLVSYTLYSGETPLHEARGSPQEILQTASYLVQATNDSVESALEADRSVNTDELSELIDRHERLTSELTALGDHIDALRRTPVGDDP